jgi:hypothetical protein
MRRRAFATVCLLLGVTMLSAQSNAGLSPLLQQGKPVDWWFVFKFNSAAFPECDGKRTCTFGGSVQPYKAYSQQFVYASSANATLQKGSGCAGDTVNDPLGATFAQVYNGSAYYVIWNDQFYNDPMPTKASPWGHSKGMVAWDDSGNGFVLQVSTPSWPAAGSRKSPRKTDGNTLGCVKDDDVEVSQHFFALRLTKNDLVSVLKALANASIVTDPTTAQIVRNGGPSDVQALVKTLGQESKSKTYQKATLSSGVQVFSKPSGLHVPPWQFVSALLGGVSMRAATWWASPEIPTTTSSTRVSCWDSSLGKPGAVQIATSGSWSGTTFGLKGGAGTNFNHAKIGVTTSGSTRYAVFGDLNQQGSLSTPKCSSSQDGRGGLFYVVNNPTLVQSVAGLIKGDSAPSR